MVVTIFYDKCNGISNCSYEGSCVKVCAMGAIEIKDDFPSFIESACSQCGLCVLNCPNEALSKN